MEEKLGRGFFSRPALVVARDILGRKLVRVSPEGITAGTVVEAEAYMGTEDPASHAFGGRRTKRNEVMWGPAGHAYIYPIYGMYLCFNVVCGQIGEPQGTFLRAVRPTEGIELMALRRRMHISGERDLRQLCSGPSKLCQAFGITREMNGLDVTGDVLFFTAGADPGEVVATGRVGVDYAGPGREWPWRFAVKDDSFVSRKA
jgi:DNA-3-methyladenine glycosylase